MGRVPGAVEAESRESGGGVRGSGSAKPAGNRALTLDHVRKLAERFKASAALFVG